ncbi:MAG TPA: CoA ester lyase [Burkholderiaceae bacterium]|nr:CoA ester lyase [Burkholderiaceae bacterium]
MANNSENISQTRLQRTYLAVPGNASRFFEKAAASSADAIFLDLEDAVAPPDKEIARAQIIDALQRIDWGRKTMTVRINTLSSPYMYRDVIELVEHCPRLDCLLIPKVNKPEDVYVVEALVNQVELATGRRARVGLEALIETAEGLSNVEAIARSESRLEALHFGAGDFAASIAARTMGIGGVHPGYVVSAGGLRSVADMWHYAQMRIVVACRAYGLRPIDGPYGDYADPAGTREAAERAAILGFEGKQTIHPSQLEAINQVFTPAEAEIQQAERIIEAMREAEQAHRGAVALDGKLIDLVSIRMAENILDKAEMIRLAGMPRQ